MSHADLRQPEAAARRAVPAALALWLLCSLALGAAAADIERERIAAERSVVEARFAAAKADCQARFMVTECMDAARSERRQALAALQTRQLSIDDARRRERAAERQRQQLARAQEAMPAASAPLQRPTRRLAAEPVAAGAARPTRPAGTAASSPAPSEAALAQRRRLEYLQRQQTAIEHQNALDERNARQAARRPPADGLPVPVPMPADSGASR